MVGSLSVRLFWSRDKINWQLVSPSLISGNNVYRGSIPRQDGFDNQWYDDGQGYCFWYVEIENSKNEKDTYFSLADPNDEIYFYDYQSQQPTEVIGTTYVSPPSPLQPLADVISNIFGGQNPFNDPNMQILLLVIVVIFTAVIATRGGGVWVRSIIIKLFKR